MLTPRRHRDPGHAARIAAELYGGSLREDPALARELLHATARPGAARGYYYQLLSGLGWTSLPRLRKLRPPTLILAGDDDPIIPLVNARIMDRLIPHSQLHVYHGGHLELGVGAGRLAPVVEAFLDAPHRRWQAELNSQGLFALQLLYVTLGNSMHIGRVTGFNVIRSMNQGEGEMHTVADLGAGERIEPLTCRLQELRPSAPYALAATMARATALTALAALELSDAAFHEPFHANGPATVHGRNRA
jgi:hypothetical protein